MRLSCAITTPEIATGPLALLSGAFIEKLQKARRLGYSGIELMVRDPRLLDVREIKQQINQHGLQLAQIVTGELFGTDGLALVHPDPRICERALDRMQVVIDFAGELCPNVLVNIGRVRGRKDWLSADDQPDAYNRFIRVFQNLSDYAIDHEVRLALEPCNRYEVDFVRNTAEALEVVHDVNKQNFGLMLDLFHMNIEDPSIECSLRDARDHLWHIHIADSNRLAPGQGHINFPAIIKTLHEIGYEGFLSAELFPLPDADTAAQQTIAYMICAIQ